ncbi:MAG: carboxypeptidase-like regulatory domain-containing protein [Planctomycetota bacterium]
MASSSSACLAAAAGAIGIVTMMAASLSITEPVVPPASGHVPPRAEAEAGPMPPPARAPVPVGYPPAAAAQPARAAPMPIAAEATGNLLFAFVHDDRGAPIEGATTVAEPIVDGERVLIHASTDARGVAALSGAPLQPLAVTAWSSCHLPAVAVWSGATTELVDLTLQPAATLLVSVTSGTGERVAASVRLYRDPFTWQAAACTPAAPACFPCAPPQVPLGVEVLVPGGAPAFPVRCPPLTLCPRERRELVVDLPQAQPLTLHLLGCRQIEIAHSDVAEYPYAPWDAIVLDATGQDRIEARLLPGCYAISADGASALAVSVPGTSELVLAARATSPLTGTLHDPAGAPLSGRDVIAFQGERVGHARTTAQGEFELSGLEPDLPVTLVFSGAHGEAEALVAHGVAAGTRVEIVQRSARVEGVVRGVDGTALRAMVRLSKRSEEYPLLDLMSGGGEATTATDAHGCFAVDELSLGIWEITATRIDESAAVAVRTVALRDGGMTGFVSLTATRAP